MNSRKYQANETKCKIIRESMKLFENHSFDEITVDMICQECGLSKGAFYHHFKTKEELIVKYYTQALDFQLIEEIEPLIGKLPLSELVDRYVDVDVSFFSKLGQEWVILLQQSSLKNPEYYGTQNIQIVFEEIFKYSAKSGEVMFKKPVDDCIQFLYCVMQGFITQWCIKRDSVEALAEMKDYMRLALSACIVSE